MWFVQTIGVRLTKWLKSGRCSMHWYCGMQAAGDSTAVVSVDMHWYVQSVMCCKTARSRIPDNWVTDTCYFADRRERSARQGQDRGVPRTSLCYRSQQLQSTKWRTCSLTPSTPAVQNCCRSQGSAPYWSNPPFLMFDIRALWRSVLSARAPECQKLKMVG